MSVLEQLAALARLAAIDDAATEFEAELKALPARIEEMRSDVAKLEGLLAHERRQFEEVLALKSNQEAEVAQRNELLARAKAKAAKARSAKEADAAEREVEANRRAIKEREDEVLKLDEAIEQVRSQVDGHEKELNELRELCRKDEEEALARMKELEAQRDKALAGREDVATKIPRNILSRYDRVRRAKGSGVAIVTEPSCTACSIAISPQQFIQLQRAEDFEQCHNCLRVLIYKQLVED